MNVFQDSTWGGPEPAETGFWSGQRVCVTGGHGFLGREVVRLLRQVGAEVSVVSRQTGCDLRSFEQALSIFETQRPEIVVNCASNQGGIGYQQLFPGTIYYDNLLTGANTMEAARQAHVGKYVNVIAGCAYPGEPRDGLLREAEFEAGPMHPTVDNYGATKRAAVMQAKCLRRQYGFQAISLILINLYGPGEHFHPDRSHALAALIRKFYEAKRTQAATVTLWGSGQAVREWLYVEDAARGLLRATECYADVEPLNIAVGDGYTIAELAKVIKDIVGFEGEIVFDRSKPDGALRKVGDTSKMRAALNWQPETDIRAGIRATLDWFAENYDEAIQ
jgi:GDP-L-fucose synthase